MEIENKQQAISIIAIKIKRLFNDANYSSPSEVEFFLKEIKDLAKEWDVPFSWELHERVLFQVQNKTSWDSSGCSFGEETYSSWDSSSYNC